MSSQQRQPRSRSESPEEQANSTHQEARMVLPGIQALFGFQLIATFSQRFMELDGPDRLVHLVSLVLVALAIVLIMTPAAYHRIVEPGRTSTFFNRLASALVAMAMVPLLMSISLDIYVVTRLVVPDVDPWLGIAMSLATFAVYVGLWMVFPYWQRAHPQHRMTVGQLRRWFP